MAVTKGKYESRTEITQRGCPYLLVPLSLFLLEVFAFFWLRPENVWPLLFGILWAVILGGILWILPEKGSRLLFTVMFALMMVYAVGQTGYYQLFSEMMWLLMREKRSSCI